MDPVPKVQLKAGYSKQEGKNIYNSEDPRRTYFHATGQTSEELYREAIERARIEMGRLHPLADLSEVGLSLSEIESSLPKTESDHHEHELSSLPDDKKNLPEAESSHNTQSEELDSEEWIPGDINTYRPELRKMLSQYLYFAVRSPPLPRFDFSRDYLSSSSSQCHPMRSGQSPLPSILQSEYSDHEGQQNPPPPVPTRAPRDPPPPVPPRRRRRIYEQADDNEEE